MADLRNDGVTEARDRGDHWLVRPRTIRRLWAGFAAILALTVIAQAVVPIEAYFGIDGWPGFAAAFGFLSCICMVVIAKLLGTVLKRKDDYYDA